MAMVPHERSLVERLENKPFVLVGINEDDSRETLQQTVKKKNMPWRSFWDKDGAIAQQWDPAGGLPFIALIDHTGKVRQTFLGRPKDEVLEGALDKLIQEAEQAGREPKS